jgi:hypothetical protein
MACSEQIEGKETHIDPPPFNGGCGDGFRIIIKKETHIEVNSKRSKKFPETLHEQLISLFY